MAQALVVKSAPPSLGNSGDFRATVFCPIWDKKLSHVMDQGITGFPVWPAEQRCPALPRESWDTFQISCNLFPPAQYP